MSKATLRTARALRMLPLLFATLATLAGAAVAKAPAARASAAGNKPAAVAKPAPVAGTSADSAVIRDLLAGVDARASVAEAIAHPQSRAGKALATPHSRSFANYAQGVRQLQSALIAGRNAWSSAQKAQARQRIDGALTGLLAEKLLVDARIAQVDALVAGKQMPAVARARWSEHRSALMAQLAALDDAAQRASATLASAPGATLPTFPELETQVAIEAARSAPARLGASLPMFRPRLAAREPQLTPVITPTYADAANENFPTPADLAATDDAPLSPAILAQAQQLGNNYAQIFDFVRSQVRTQWYAGAQKGAEGTLRTLAGNDIDQASLLIALLRASGAGAHYVRAVVQVPVADLAAMLGVREDEVGLALGAAGVANSPLVSAGKISAYRLDHVFVSAYVPMANYRGSAADLDERSWIPLAAALKPHAFVPAAGALAKAGVVVDTFVHDYLGAPQTLAPLDLLRSKVSDALSAQTPATSYASQLATLDVNAPAIGLLPASLPVPVELVTGEFAELPDALKQHARIVVRSGPAASDAAVLDVILPITQLRDHRVTLAYAPASIDDGRIADQDGGQGNTPPFLVHMRPTLNIAGLPAAHGTGEIENGATHRIEITLDSPGGSASLNQQLTAGGLAAIVFDAQDDAPPQQADDVALLGESETKAARVLANFGARYLTGWDQADAELANLVGVGVMRPLPSVALVINQYSVSRVGGVVDSLTWQGVGLDAALRPVEPFTQTQNASAASDWLQLAGLHGSALEHQLFEQQWNVDSISADKGLQLAQSNHLPVLTLTQATGTAGVNQPQSVLDDVAQWLNAGYVVDIPRDPITYESWQGAVWRVHSLSTGESGYFIAGGLAGGATAMPPEAWYFQDLVALLGNPYGEQPDDDPQSGAILALDADAQRQDGVVGTTLAKPLRATVLDQIGRPVLGAQVQFSVSTGGGKLIDASNGNSASQVVVSTDAHGEASVQFKLDTKQGGVGLYRVIPDKQYPQWVGYNSVEVTAASRVGVLYAGESYVAFSLPDQASKIAFLGSDIDLIPQISYDSLGVNVTDQYDNAVSNVPVNISAATSYDALTCNSNGEQVDTIDATLFAPGQCPTDVVQLTGNSCATPAITLTSRSGGAPFFVVPPATGLAHVTLTGSAGGSNATLQMVTTVYADPCHFSSGVAIAAWAYSPIFGQRPMLAPDYEVALLNNYTILDAAAPGQVMAVPQRIDAFTYDLVRGTHAGVNITPALNGEFSSDLHNGDLESTREIGGGSYLQDLRAGNDPGPVHGEIFLTFHNGLRVPVPGAPRTNDPSSDDLVFAWSVAMHPPLATPSPMPLTPFKATAVPLDIHGASLPSDYVAAPVQLEVKQGEDVIASVTTPAAKLGDFFTQLGRGLIVDPTKQYSVRQVINDGTPFRMESDSTQLTFGQGIVGGYGMLPHVADTAPLTAAQPTASGSGILDEIGIVEGRYPKSISINDSVDVASGYSCVTGKRFAFLLEQAATVSLVFHRIDQQGNVSPIAAFTALDNVAEPEGLTDLTILSSDLPIGDYQYELKATAGDGTVEDYLGSAAHHTSRRDSLPLAHPFVKGVDLFSGGAVLSEEDIAVGGRGPGMKLSRTYASHQGDVRSWFGRGWSSDLDMQVLVDDCNTRVVTGSAGQGQRFAPSGSDPDGTAHFTALHGYHGTLLQKGAEYDFFAKDGTRYHFAQVDTNGPRLSYVEDTNGQRVNYTYEISDAAPHVVRIDDRAGRHIDLNYVRREVVTQQAGIPIQDSFTVVDNVQGPGGLRLNYEYDDNANLKKVTRTDGGPGVRTQGYDYVDKGGLFVQQPDGEFTYYRFGWRLSVAHNVEDGGTRQYDYQMGWSAHYDGTNTRYEPEQRTLSVTEPDNGKTVFTYPEVRGISAVTSVVKDARGHDTNYELNRYGAATTVQEPAPAGSTITDWDMTHLEPHTITDAVGTITTYGYDSAGNKTSEHIAGSGGRSIDRSWTYKPQTDFPGLFIRDRVESMTDGNHNQTTYEYDTHGNRRHTTLFGITESDGYDANGDHSSHTDGLNHSWIFHYDTNGYPSEAIDPLSHSTKTTYDIRGRKLDETDANLHQTTYTYDSRDRVLSTTYPDTAAGTGVAHSIYNDAADTRTDTNPNSHSTVSTFDKMGRLKTVKHADNHTRSLGYDENGNLTSETDFTGNSTGYVYDNANRRQETDAPMGRVTLDEYDALGHLTKETVSGPNSATRVTDYEYKHPLYKRTLVRRHLDAGTNADEASVYDDNGNLTIVTDPEKRITTRHYDARNRMYEENAPYGRKTTTTFYDDDRIKDQTVANPGHEDQVTAYEYDNAGRLVATTDAVHDRRTIGYDNTKNVTSRSDARNFQTTYKYDGRDQLTKETGPETGQTTTYGYDLAGNRTSETWPNGNVRSSFFDLRERRYLTNDAVGMVESFTYTSDDEVQSRTDANSHTTTNHYDELHRVYQQDLPSVGGQPRQIIKTFDVHGDALTEQDPGLHLTTHAYDALGRRTSTTLPSTDSGAATLVFGYDLVDRPTLQQNARNQQTIIAYDDTQHTKTQTDPSTPDGGFSQVWTYDALNNEVSHKDRRGFLTETGYDAANRIVTIKRNNLVTSTRHYDRGYLDTDTDANSHATQYKYDNAGRKNEEDRPRGFRRTWKYKPMGDVETATDADNRTTIYSYTPRRYLLTETNNVGEKTTYDYDGEGHRTLMQRPQSPSHAWHYHYDEADRLDTVTDAYGTTIYGYDADGNRTSQQDANLNTTLFHYDARHLRRCMAYPGVGGSNCSATWGYDVDGNVTSETTPNGRVRGFHVDALNRVSDESIGAALPSEIATVLYGHDGNGNLTSVAETVGASSRLTTRSYDDFDRLDTETDADFGQATPFKSLQYHYDAVGNRQRVTNLKATPASDITTWTFNELNQNDSVTPAGQGATSIAYFTSGLVHVVKRPGGSKTTTEYDDAGRVSSIVHADNGGGEQASEKYDYDLDGNRWHQWESNGSVTGGATQLTTYTYDLADRLTNVEAPERKTDYMLDPVGNRTHELITATAGGTLGDSTLVYNEREQLITRDDAATHLHVGLAYDADGNTKTETDASGTLTFTWDGHDRLLSLDHGGGTPALTFDYHSDGLRIAKHLDTTETRYQYDGQSLLAETNSIGNPLVYYHYSATELLSRSEVAGTTVERQYLNDALHTPIATANNGSIDSRTRYDAWGEVISQQAQGSNVATPASTDGTFAELPSADHQDIGFTGYVKDSESGFYYAKARYYDPRIARFASEDPVEGKAMQPPSLHRYLYVYANPTAYIDETGRSGVLTDARDRLNQTDDILRSWAIEAGDSGGVLGNAGYVGASVARAVVGLGSLPWRLLNLTSDGLAQTAPIAAIAPNVADTASSEFGETVDTTALIVKHPINTGVAISQNVATSAKRLQAGDRGAGSDVISFATGFLGPGLLAKLEEAANAANAARRTADALGRSMDNDLRYGFELGDREGLPTSVGRAAMDPGEASATTPSALHQEPEALAKPIGNGDPIAPAELHPDQTGGRTVVPKDASGELELTIERKEGLNQKEFDRKINRLQNSMQKDGLRSNIPHEVSDAERRALTRKYRADVVARIKSFFATDPEAAENALNRLRNSDIDHIKDLQLDGKNIYRNLKSLDSKVNQELGRQISRQLPRGVKKPITKIQVKEPLGDAGN